MKGQVDAITDRRPLLNYQIGFEANTAQFQDLMTICGVRDAVGTTWTDLNGFGTVTLEQPQTSKELYVSSSDSTDANSFITCEGFDSTGS